MDIETSYKAPMAHNTHYRVLQLVLAEALVYRRAHKVGTLYIFPGCILFLKLVQQASKQYMSAFIVSNHQ